MTAPAPAALLALHVDAMFVHAAGRITWVNDWQPRPAPRFWLGRTAGGNLWRFHASLPSTLTRELEVLCRREPAAGPDAIEPRFESEYRRLLEADGDAVTPASGPCYAFTTSTTSPPFSGTTVPVSLENAALLEGGLDDWLPDVPHQQPMVASVVEGQAVAVCASVRIRAGAYAAGVETLPAFRRQGHAVAAVAGWARAVRRLGAIPLYSTSWSNVASQSVAASLGLRAFGSEFQIN